MQLVFFFSIIFILTIVMNQNIRRLILNTKTYIPLHQLLHYRAEAPCTFLSSSIRRSSCKFPPPLCISKFFPWHAPPLVILYSSDLKLINYRNLNKARHSCQFLSQLTSHWLIISQLQALSWFNICPFEACECQRLSPKSVMMLIIRGLLY